MGIGLNILTSTEASKWVQDSAFQTLSEGSLKAVGRPLFTLNDKSADPEARKYSASKEFIFQTISMAAYFAIITTVFQGMGFKALKKLPKFKDFDAIQKMKNFSEFSHTFDAFSKGKIWTNAKETEQLEKTKGAMELIKIAGSGIILTVLCPMFVTKLVHPIMGLMFKGEKGNNKQAQNVAHTNQVNHTAKQEPKLNVKG